MFKKKKIAFVLGNPMIGGVETSLVNLLNIFDYEKYDVSLFTSRQDNPCIDNLPSAVHIYFFDDYSIRNIFFDKIKKIKLFSAAKILFYYILIKLSNKDSLKCKYAAKAFKITNIEYDCAIAYKQDLISITTALFQINAPQRAIWIHGELFHRKRGGYDPLYLKYISLFDKIFCVSEDRRHCCNEIFPDLSHKIDVFHNILDEKKITFLASKPIPFHNDTITLLTVGRLSQEKGQNMIPEVAHLLKSHGYRFLWYIIGDGNTRNIIEKQIRKYNVNDQVILLGAITNPYPYMKACDIYVQTSYAEGWCLTTQEAKILQKPIVTTDLLVMREQFTHMENGFITNGISAESLYDGIRTLIDQPQLRLNFVNNLPKTTSNNNDIHKLYDFLNS